MTERDRAGELSREIARKHEESLRRQARADYDAVMRAKAEKANSPERDEAASLADAEALLRDLARNVDFGRIAPAARDVLAEYDLLRAAQARSAKIEAAARDVVTEWSKPEVDMAEVGFLLDDLVRVLGEGT